MGPRPALPPLHPFHQQVHLPSVHRRLHPRSTVLQPRRQSFCKGRVDQELATRLDELENLRKQIYEQSRKLKTNSDELRDTKGYVAELEAEAEVAAERVQAVETELESIQSRLRDTVNGCIHAHERVEELEEEGTGRGG